MHVRMRAVALTGASAVLLAASGWGAVSAFGVQKTPKNAVVFSATRVAGAKGQVLVEGKGLVVYTFVGDHKGGKPTCTGACAAIWPAVRGVPVLAHGMKIKGKFGRIGGQVTFNGMPLYGFTGERPKSNHADSEFKVVMVSASSSHHGPPPPSPAPSSPAPSYQPPPSPPPSPMPTITY